MNRADVLRALPLAAARLTLAPGAGAADRERVARYVGALSGLDLVAVHPHPPYVAYQRSIRPLRPLGVDDDDQP